MHRREDKGSRRLFPLRVNTLVINIVVVLLVMALPVISGTAQPVATQGMAAMSAPADVAPIDTSSLAHKTTVQSAAPDVPCSNGINKTVDPPGNYTGTITWCPPANVTNVQVCDFFTTNAGGCPSIGRLDDTTIQFT